MFKFEKLEVWKKVVDLAHEVHLLTRNWPKEEMYSLTSQIKRASDSVSLNIAEGSTGQSDKEFSRFLGIALRSCIEVVSCIHLAIRRKYITQNQFDEVYSRCEEGIKMIQSFRNKLK